MSVKSKLIRKVIIHKHLFKNAGTTFDWSLKKNFENSFCDHREDMPMRKHGEAYLIKYLEENPKIKALSSHHIWFHFSQNENIELIPIYILRHPIERIRSVYNFEKLQESNTLGAQMAKKMSFSEYVNWRMDKSSPATIRNFHTRFCCGKKTAKPLTDKDYQLAVEEINKTNCVGIVDHYKDSMVLFEKELKKMGIKVDLSFKAQNVKQDIKNIDYEKRANTILNELGDELAEKVIQENQYDIDLYHLVKRKFIK